jgi:hypothetical protein
MRTSTIVDQWFDGRFEFVHAQRREALKRATGALLNGGKLWLSSLGRCRDGTSAKHAIKAIDRLLGNRALHQQRLEIFRAIAEQHVPDEPVVLVDVTELRPDVCALTASLAANGRSVPLYAMVRRKATIGKRRTQQVFLRALKKLLPNDAVVTIVTDAGFQSPWFDEVAALGWHYVCRVRHRTLFFLEEEWVSAQQLHTLASDRAKDLGAVAFPRQRPKKRRLVLAARRVSKKRVRKTKRGKRSRHYNDRRCEKSAREPWLLATSLDLPAKTIVKLYGLRMQIEQNYRDTKNHRWGWALEQSRSRSHARLEMLLLLGALGMAIVLAIGCLAEKRDWHRAYQANTIRDRRVISWFVLGAAIARREPHRLTPKVIRDGTRELSNELRSLADYDV